MVKEIELYYFLIELAELLGKSFQNYEIRLTRLLLASLLKSCLV